MIIHDEEVCIVTILSMYACNNALINIGFSAEMEIRMTWGINANTNSEILARQTAVLQPFSAGDVLKTRQE